MIEQEEQIPREILVQVPLQAQQRLEESKERRYPRRQKERAQRRFAKEAIKHRHLILFNEELSIEVLSLIDSIRYYFKCLEKHISTDLKIESCSKLGTYISRLAKWIVDNNKNAPEKVIYVLTKNLEGYKEKLIKLNNKLKIILELSSNPFCFPQQRPLIYSEFYTESFYSLRKAQTEPEDTYNSTYKNNRPPRKGKGHHSN